MLDIAFREDESRARQGRVRQIALNLLKWEQTAKVGIKNKQLKAAWDERYLLKVITG